MCGICGFISHNLDSSAVIEAMARALLHRGPDGVGTWVSDTGTLAVGQTRLAIIDLIRGQQPMHTTDGRYVIVFNGEIYNYRDLRRQLSALGYSFITDSDTEVLLHGFHAWGRDLLGRLHGMFAFALYDRSEDSLLLARDPVGIKPLYYYQGREGFFFASEIKSILEAGIPRQLNFLTLADYLVLGYPLLPYTFFTGLRELEPGNWLEVTAEGTTSGNYWQWQPREADWDKDTSLAVVENALTESLAEHLVADVPIGAFLSGGIDSSLLVALLVRKLNVKLDTFNVQFGDAAFDESAYAQEVAEHLGTNHHTLKMNHIQPDVEQVTGILQQFDQPFADSSAIPTFFMSQEIRRYVKVALGGDGGDEMFGGYRRFQYADLAQRIGRTPGWLRYGLAHAAGALAPIAPDVSRMGRRLLHVASGRGDDGLLSLSGYYDVGQLGEILRPAVYECVRAHTPSLTFVSNGNDRPGGRELRDTTVRQVLASHYLRKVDVMSGAHGLEVREPYLGIQVLACAQALPRRWQHTSRENKLLLRELARRYLPESIVLRPKRGFSIPLDSWLGSSGRTELHSRMTSQNANINRLIQSRQVRPLLDSFVSGRWDRAHTSRYMLFQRVYQLWALEDWLAKWQPSF